MSFFQITPHLACCSNMLLSFLTSNPKPVTLSFFFPEINQYIFEQHHKTIAFVIPEKLSVVLGYFTTSQVLH